MVGQSVALLLAIEQGAYGPMRGWRSGCRKSGKVPSYSSQSQRVDLKWNYEPTTLPNRCDHLISVTFILSHIVVTAEKL
jgi:hypothetical protein